LRARGSADSVISLHDYLDWGPIDCSLVDRAAWLDRHSAYEDSWDWLIECTEEFREKASALERPVVWVAPKSANELSALFWYAHHVGIDGAQMRVADFPLEGGWRDEPPLSLGELPAELLGLILDRPAQPWDSRRFPPEMWAQLVREAALLRVVLDGRLQSVPADFFDDALLKNAPAEWTPFYRIIGQTMAGALDDHRLDDSFLRWRLSELVHAGALELDGSLAVHGVKDAGKVRRVRQPRQIGT